MLPLSKREQKAVLKGLTKAQEEGHIQVEVLEPASLNQLRAHLTEHQPHVFHFDGHGVFGKRCHKDACRTIPQDLGTKQCNRCGADLPKPQGYLLFETEDDEADYVSAIELGELLQKTGFGDQPHQRGGVLVAVLNACKSGMALGGESVFNGVAQRLINHRLPAVVAMQYTVRVDSATQFAEQFYRSLGQKNALATALSQGQAAMGAEGNQWYRPLLYLRWQDNEGGQLFSSSEDYSEDWSILLAQTEANLNVIQDKIGNEVFLPRIPTLNELELVFSGHRVAVLLGPSGCGKTVIAKAWAKKELNAHKILWWNARSFDVSDFQTFQSYLGLTHSLNDVLSAHSDAPAYLVVDGLDRLFHTTAFQNLAILIHVLRLDSESSPWRILIPCQLEEWGRVQLALIRANVSVREWQTIEVSEPSADDLEPVWRAFPALNPLRFQRHLQSLLLKPKVLDLLATKLSTGISVDTTQWVGESNLIDWFWEAEVSRQPNATARANFLKDLGRKQADDLETETPTDTFPPSDVGPLDSLINDRLCRQREERLSFCHDLYGDWARQRVLLGRSNSLPEYLESRVASPLWHRAIRLYGLYLLEKQEDVTRWRTVLNSLLKTNGEPDLAGDLLLESVIFAAYPLPLLERLWFDLAAQDGYLLRRLLGRFLYVATVPNPLIQKILSQTPETRSAIIDRLPWWSLWIPMLWFLHQHQAEVIDLAPELVAEISAAWLWRGGERAPLSREVAELALMLAEQLPKLKKARKFTSRSENKVEQLVYRAALAGVRELPDRVTNFALKLARRRETQAKKRTTVRRIFDTYKVELPLPWEDGPIRQVNSEFRDACLETDALYPLIFSHPEVACEVFLALLIKEPVAPAPLFERQSYSDDSLEIASVEAWAHIPPFYNRGPFLFFLQNRPTEGLKIILRLVNFATERWATEHQDSNKPIPKVVIPFPGNEREWIGDHTVYYWYRGHHRCPKPIVIALMALEKWLYDQTDSDRDIHEAIELILRQSNSLAFAGLLSAVGCKEPQLFLGSLQPFLGVPEFHQWDQLLHHPVSELHSPIGSWSADWWDKDEGSLKLAREWHTSPHREQGIDTWALLLFINAPEMASFFEQVRSNWYTQLQKLEEIDESKNSVENLTAEFILDRHFLERLIAEYDIDNYVLENHPKHGEIWRFNPTESMLSRQEQYSRENDSKELLLFFPIQCKKILDEGHSLDEEMLSVFWDKLQSISQLTLPNDSESIIHNIEDAVCGGAAVLIKLHPSWSRQNPDKEEWCITQIVKTIFSPPSTRGFDRADTVLRWSWDVFCAQIIPILWVQHPDHPTLRQCIIRLALNYHYETVKVLFESAANCRVSLGDNFKQLQNFILRWAVMRWKRDYADEEEADFNIDDWVQQEAESFVQKKTSSFAPLLEELVDGHTLTRLTTIGTHHRESKYSPNFDLLLVQAAYSWLPALEEATSEAERSEWIAFWKSALGCLVYMYGGTTEEEEERRIEPFWDWDEWVIDHTIPLILQLRLEENPKAFWQPILSLGRRAKFLVERFLNNWVSYGLQSEPASEAFLREWREMVEFALISPHWNSNLFYLEEAWCNLMGFGAPINLELWNEAQKLTIKKACDLYQLWANKHLDNPRSAIKFMIFLKQPAAEEILLDGLIWLEQGSNRANQWFWQERDIQAWCASLLEQSWRCHAVQIRQRPETFSAFRNLLKKLADFQNPLALEIQQRMV